MPFYEYECSNCKFYTELLQKVSDPPLKKCPSCGKPAMKKLVSAPVFRLKGGGWYETDFKSDKEGRRNLAGGEEPAANESSIEGKPEKEAKPAEGKAAESKGEATSKADAPAAPRRRAVAAPAKRAPAKRAAARSKPKAKPPARKKRR